MALVIINRLDGAFNISGSATASLVNTTAGTPTVFTNDTTNGSSIEFTGTGFTFAMSPPPTGGTVNAITYDQLTPEASGFRDIEIYGLNLGLIGFQSFVGTAAEQNSQFWRVALGGDDIILLPIGDTTIEFVFAGDGADLLSTSGVNVGGSDDFVTGGGAFTAFNSQLFGDYTNIQTGASAVGGDDFFSIALPTTAGDFGTVFAGGVAFGGDDELIPLTLSNNNGSAIILSGDAALVFGSLSGGRDLIDLRGTDVASAGLPIFLVGDTNSVFTSSLLYGGDDTIHGSSAAETIDGEVMNGEFTSAVIRGGNDLLFGHDGNDTINGDAGNDTISGGDGADFLTGGAGRDTADYSDKTGGVSVNLFSGTAITGGALSGAFYVGGAVEDSLATFENVIGTVFGDRLVASNAASGRLNGSGGSDNISGLNGADTLFGDAGNDTLDGGAASDTLNGGAGTDTLNGNSGLDTADYSDRDGGVNVNLINGTGITGGAMSGANYVGGALEDTIIGVENAIGSAFGDRLVGVSAGSVIDGGGGNDRISGFSGVDVFRGGVGDDTLEAGGNNDTLNGGLGFDTIDGSTGNDTVDYSDRSVSVLVDLILGIGVSGGTLAGGVYFGGLQEDTLFNIENIIGSNYNDRLVTRGGNAVADGRGGSDFIVANTGNDSLTGGTGNDTIDGAGGGDTLKGGRGDDSLTGGTGDDQFFFAFGEGTDVISDFTAGGGVDEIQISGFGFFSSFAAVIGNAFQSGADTVLDFGGTQFLTLQNVTLANLTAGDFVFS